MESPGIIYTGEHLLLGQIGHFSVLLLWVSSLLSGLSYYLSVRKDAPGWKAMGRGAFISHAIALVAVIGSVFLAMTQKYYEYHYVWTHVSDELPFRYLFAAFWEGQEGSFLLWMFWNAVLGLLLMATARRWESPVLAVFAGVQAILASMILGIYVGWGDAALKIGSSPFQLLRDVMDAPLFQQVDYLELVKGNGLNPLLQNYWMTIHPPTLFLGFSSTLVPFAFAIAGLWIKDYSGWLKSALPWSLFSAGILGTGILMGGAWAYEALSFGGYWAWDPVENMSLVPWLVLIAGIHTHLIARSTQHSLRGTYLFYILQFALVVYSTFLTRSGVLGETSVHAFTEMGLESQLLFFLGAVTLLPGLLFFWRNRNIPSPEKEELVPSREFWMFMGSLVLFFSALLIAGSTSLPVWNKIRQLFDPLYAGKVITEPIAHYNKYQIWIALLIMIMSGAAQFLRFRESKWGAIRKKFFLTTLGQWGISVICFYPINKSLNPQAWQYSLLLFAAIYGFIANLWVLVSIFRLRTRWVSSVLSHSGFAVMIIGILFSGLNKQIISDNPFIMEGLIEGASEESSRRNILLFKETPMRMSSYEVNYYADSLDHYTRTYFLKFVGHDESGRRKDSFTLTPSVIYDKSFKKIAASNPSTHRYIDRDIFTHIASLPQVEMDMELRKQKEDSLKFERLAILPKTTYIHQDHKYLGDKDTLLQRDYSFRIMEVDYQPSHPEYTPEEGDLAIGLRMEVSRSDDKKSREVTPVLVLRENLLYSYPVQINPWSTRIRLPEEILPRLYTFEEDLRYEKVNLKVGESFLINENRIRFDGFVRNPKTPEYQMKEGDLAVGANLLVQGADNQSWRAMPVFLIRNGEPLNVKKEIHTLGLHLRFPLLDPRTEEAEIMYAIAPAKEGPIPVEIATDSFRSDYIVLEALAFPGINLFWGGSCLMLAGLFLGMVLRFNKKRVDAVT